MNLPLVHQICQVIIGLGILNVWILRFGKATKYRGGDSRNLKEEFAAYGLPGWMVWVIGSLKVGAALALLLGLLVPQVVEPAAMLMTGLMVGAVVMHVKVQDPPLKFLPALVLLALSLFLVLT